SLAGVPQSAGIRVVTGAPVGLGWRRRAYPRPRVADSRIVTLIGSRAYHRVGTVADAGGAGVGLGARIAVAADRAVGLYRGSRANPRGGIAGPGIVAGVGGGANHGIRPGADPRLAAVGLGAGVTVVARGAVGHRRVLA